MLYTNVYKKKKRIQEKDIYPVRACSLFLERNCYIMTLPSSLILLLFYDNILVLLYINVIIVVIIIFEKDWILNE